MSARHAVELAGGGAQLQEVAGGAETRLFDHAEDRLAHAALKTRLHEPDLAHVRREAALDGQLLGLFVQHRISGLRQGGNGVLALGAKLLPAHVHLLPQQGGKQEAGADGLAGAHAGVGAFQRQFHEVFAAGLFQHHVQQRQQAVVQAVGAQLAQAVHRVAAGQQLEHFVEQARGRHVFDELGHGADRLARGRVDRAVALGGEPHGAQHADRVFAVALDRVADEADLARFQVGHAIVVVDDFLVVRVVVQRVHREGAALGVFFLRAEHIVAQDAAVLVGFLVFRGGRPERRGLDDFLAEHHVHQLEAAADDAGAAKQRADLFGRGVGGHVEPS
ncbi:hypothetical protein G6F22_014741 [Rhizopus arrhizus]|nr:hypothetical protein G6F22_014741 [Rhizopus arrhizus]